MVQHIFKTTLLPASATAQQPRSVTIRDATRIQLFLANFDALFYHAVFVVTKLEDSQKIRKILER